MVLVQHLTNGTQAQPTQQSVERSFLWQRVLFIRQVQQLRVRNIITVRFHFQVQVALMQQAM